MVLVTRQEFPYTGRVLGAYEKTVELLGDLNRCHYSSIVAMCIRAVGIEVITVFGYFVPLSDISLFARLHTPLKRGEYSGNSHWWLRFPNEGYSLDIAHSQVDPENPLLIVPTFLEGAHGLFYRYDAEPLPEGGRRTKELLSIWRTAFL